MSDITQDWDAAAWAERLKLDEVFRVRLCYAKNRRHRVAHEVIAGPGFRLMSFVTWLRVVIRIRLELGEKISLDSPLLVRENRKRIVPMTSAFMTAMDRIYAPKL